MLKSMTGFGRSEIVTEERKVVVELKAVNHRYCDLTIKMPKKLSFFEASIRNLLKAYISRGKVDVFITYEDYTENKQYEKIIFVCDGNNDYCLGKKLEKNDKIFVRKDYSLYRKLYNKGWKDNLQCDIKCWENGNEIVEWLKTEI